jgi:phospholipase C
MPPIVNQSTTAADAVTGPGQCGNGTDTALPGPSGAEHAQGRCGYGPRLPYIVISPYAKPNYVDHTTLDQTSTIRFIEDNWLAGKRIGNGSFDAIAGSIDSMFEWYFPLPNKLILNTSTGEPVK